MSDARSNAADELWREVLANQAPADGPDPIDDDELLARWEAGLLEGDEHDRLIAHLARSAQSREELHALLEAGVLELSAPPESTSTTESEPVVTHQATATRPHRRSGRGLLIGSLLACGLLVAAFFGGLLPFGGGAPSPITPLLAAAERGDDAAVLDMADDLLLSASFTREEMEIVRRTLTESAVNIAREQLTRGDFEGVGTTLAKLSGWDDLIDAPQLRNLELQALREFGTELALADTGALLDYGYQLDGSPVPFKSMPMIDERTERIAEGFRNAINNHPSATDLRLNYAQFLLTQNDFEAAAEQFRAVLKTEPNNAAAHLGLGLNAFDAGEFEAAKSHFETARKRGVFWPDIFLNLAATEQRLGNTDAAIRWLNEAALSSEGELKTRIETELNRLQGETP